MYNLHRHHIRQGHSIMCVLKHGSIELIACCVPASLHNFTTYYAFPYMEAQKRVSAKNGHSCSFPNVILFTQCVLLPYFCSVKNTLLLRIITS